VTLNNLERRNGHFQVIIAKLTMDETGRATWRKIRNRINTLCIICVVIIILVATNKRVHCGDKFTVMSFASAFTEPQSTRPSDSFGHG